MRSVTPGIKLLIWMNMPSHHQAPFYKALRSAGIDLVVHYYGHVNETRISMGWENTLVLPAGETFVAPSLDSLTACCDWQERIHIVPGYGAAFTRQLAAHLSQRGVRWVHWSEPAHDGIRWWLSYPYKRWYARFVNTWSLGAFAIGHLAARDFERWGIQKSKIAFLPYSSPEGDTQHAEKDPRIAIFTRNKQPTFLFVGSLCRRKGIDLLLHATKELAIIHDSIGLVLVGKDMAKGRYQRMAETLGISQNVLFQGAVSTSKIAAALSCADVVVLPSRFDGWGMALGEAASAGKALIATNACGAAHHLIVEGENGFRVPANDATSLAQAMLAYMTDPGLAHRHGRRSQELFAEYTPHRNVERLVQGLREFESRSLQ